MPPAATSIKVSGDRFFHMNHAATGPHENICLFLAQAVPETEGVTLD